MNPKQVIVVRRDLRMSAGLMAAQVAHASVLALLSQRDWDGEVATGHIVLRATDAMKHWAEISCRKIVVGIDTEDELLEIYGKARAAGIPCGIMDDERPAFSKFTLTAVAVGPALPEQIDPITGSLPLV